MRTIAAIRTHVWTDQEDWLLAQLRPVFGDDIRVVFHNRKPEILPPVPVVDLTDDWVQTNGLRILPDYGWRCGDYSLYALRQAEPDADFYWIIEPDVYFTGDHSDFFARLAQNTADLVGMQAEELPPSHRWARSLPFTSYRCVFALTRVSGRALDHLFALRQAYSAQDIGARWFVNDEAFVWSTLRADHRFTTAELKTLVPDWTDKGGFGADPDILLDTLLDFEDRGIFHPVQSRQHFIRAVANRAAAALGFMSRLKGSLAYLTDEDMQTLVKTTMVQVRASLIAARRRGISSLNQPHTDTPEGAHDASDDE